MKASLFGGASHLPAVTEAPDRPFRTRQGAVDYLKERWGVDYSVATFAKLASVGGGPEFDKCGRTPLYTEPNLDRWVLARLRRGGKAA